MEGRRLNRLAEAAALAASAQLRDCVSRHAGVSAAGLRMGFHPRDQMLLHSLAAFDAATAVSQYFNVSVQQHRAFRQVRGVTGNAAHACRTLDFACGFGRLLRLLRAEDPGAPLWASEIQREALEFVTSEYGVRAIESGPLPARFRPGTEFDLVWVASLFSHLPRELFHAWLGRLLATLSPQGILAFSVHDMSLLPTGSTPADGLRFIPESENAELDKAIYGTTFVSEPFVSSAIAAQPGYRHVRLPRALANHQDLYVVSRRDLSALDGFRRGPWGFADIVRAEQDRALYATGWAVGQDDTREPRVTVRIDGSVHACAIDGVRTDVGEAMRDARFDRSGWTFRARLPDTPAFLEISAESAERESALLYAGFV